MSTCYITIQGNKVGLEFGFTSHSAFIEGVIKFPTKFLNEKGEMTGYAIARLFLNAHENFCLNRDIEVIYNFDSFVKYVRNCDPEESGKALELWSQSEDVKKMAEDAEKKRLTETSTSVDSGQSISEKSSESVTESLESVPGNSAG